MAFRVDSIVVSDKNVMVLSGGHQFIADVERENESANLYSKSRDKNPWNLVTEDGKIISNIFDTKEFSTRTQVVTGSSGSSNNYRQSHENFIMPSAENGYVCNCQYFGNAYTISDKTLKPFTSTYNTTSGKSDGKYEADDSFIRYEALSTYDNMVDYYITPNNAFHPSEGIQYLTEYPFGKFYSDFGDNENTEDPTIFGDSVPLKYYLNEKYSVSSTGISDTRSSFNNLRTYYGIGTTGSSLYLIYRNNLNGTSTISSNDGRYVDTHKQNNENYIVRAAIDKTTYMQNVVTMTNSTSGMMYASDPYSDFFTYDAMMAVSSYTFFKQPKDHSFTLFFKTSGTSSIITYLPKNGLDNSKSVKIIPEVIGESNTVELADSVMIATQNNGLYYVSANEGDDISNESGNSTIELNFSPFKRPKLNGKDYMDENSIYHSFSLNYNGSDILGVIAYATVSSTEYRNALLSTESNGLGKSFIPVGTPEYEITTLTVDKYSPYTEVLSSVPTAMRNPSTGAITSWTYVLSSIRTRELTGTDTSEYFDCTANAIQTNSGICFDYCPVTIDGEVKMGSYAFVQFGNYGVAKIHDSDTSDCDKFVKSTTTGPANKKAAFSNTTVLKEARFRFRSYNDSIFDKTSELSDLIDIGTNSNRIYGKPSVIMTYSDSSDNTTFNSFSTLPFDNERDFVIEPTFSSDSSSAYVEQTPISSFVRILGKPIEKSCGVTVHTVVTDNSNHDSPISLVKWNTESGKYQTKTDYTNPNASIGGLHLQYSGICTEMLVTTKKVESEDGTTTNYNTTVYEYPHSCYGNLVTAGTGLSIFDGSLSASMTVDDIQNVNGYIVVKNFAVNSETKNITSSSISETVRNCGKTYSHDTGELPDGGYVVTNFFKESECNIGNVYDSKLMSSSKEKTKTDMKSETVYDYNYLWHIRPSNGIEFYPASENGKKWKPYYVTKYVDFIKYHNGYYYIALSSSKTKGSGTIGYELIETTDLFKESPCKKLASGTYVSGIRFYDNNVAVEYTDANNSKTTMWFRQGSIISKTYPIAYCNTTDFENGSLSSINRSELRLTEDMSSDARATYDNVEVIHSLNRFQSAVSHKSNFFSIKISELGLAESPYLNETQKNNLRTWFKNKVSNIVDTIKPAHTQLFDIYID